MKAKGKEALQGPRVQNPDQRTRLLGDIKGTVWITKKQGRSSLDHPSSQRPISCWEWGMGRGKKGEWEDKPSPKVLTLRRWTDMACVDRVCSDGKARLFFGVCRIGGRRKRLGFCSTAEESWPLCFCLWARGGSGTARIPKVYMPKFQEDPRVKWTQQEQGHSSPMSCLRRCPPPDEGTLQGAAGV